ncbi:FAD-dependent oxidoreductase [Nocardioides sp. L-11A]|uniref:oxidoreductase n=1 Tax=Nocardioides sp. L-11A TaxID=3043848 RepID=UPI00249ADCCD|nr:FAD-dependent oxidoreductase [Nocardioides sp. L-11A]
MRPFDLRTTRLRNRVVFPGHTTNFGVDSLPTQRHRDYLSRRARGGAAMVVTEAVRVHPTSAGRDSTLGSYHPDVVPAFAALADAVHGEGATLLAQLMHAGRQAAGDSERTAAWSASAVPWTYGGPVPHVMTVQDIAVVTESFRTAARRMAEAGLDGVEIHLGHGHLLQQFLSPATNQRDDGYGGALERRMRLTREVLTAVSSQLPDSMLLGIRISAHEFLPGGLEPDDVVEIVDRLRADFRIDLLHVSHSAYVGQASLSTQIADMSHGPAPYREFPRRFKQAFPEIPVVAVCRIDDLAIADDLLEAGDADLVALARAQIADPDLVRKTAGGRVHEVRRCLACNQACIGRIEHNLPLSCVANPAAGQERIDLELRGRARGERRSVLVVGAGPAGLQAAVTAARAGARTVLIEARDDVGGQLRSARTLAGRERLGVLVDDLYDEARRRGVDIRLGVELAGAGPAAADGPDPRDFDHVVLATGATSRGRPLTGVTKHGVDVLDGETAATALGAGEWSGRRRRVAVVDDEGSWIAAGLVEALGRDGHRVHLVSPAPQLFGRVTLYSRVGLLGRLEALPVSSHLARRPVSVTAGGLVLVDAVGGSGSVEVLRDVDLVIDLPARQARTDVWVALEESGLGPRVLVVGDALAPRSLVEATYEAHRAVLHALAAATPSPPAPSPVR